MSSLDIIIDAIESLSNRVSELEASEYPNIIIKADTGNPATGITGNILINTFDNKAFIWADSGWREVASW